MLKEVNRIEMVSLVDNSIDFLSTIGRNDVQNVVTWVKKCKGKEWFERYFRYPVAEHGFSAIIKVYCDNDLAHSILFDTGISSNGVLDNARAMGIDLSGIEAIILSHGHYDHFGGLVNVVREMKNKSLPIIVHEDMFKVRGVLERDGTIRRYPVFPSEERVKPSKYVKTKGPYILFDNSILVTGEIPRKTGFEKGVPKQYFYENGEWKPDPWVWDDRAIVMKVKNRGLVIVSGCGHAGIVNTVKYARELTGTEKVYAIVGGFHLSGKDYEDAIDNVVAEIKKVNPKLVVPSHCTGWRGAFKFAQELPEAFVWNSVGNMYKI
ncbi:MAG: MBL fold metallo-hydrolase [Nitrososphaeria archaeon]